MARLQSRYADIKQVYREEINKPIVKKRGTVILQYPETTMKTKYEYKGICRIKDGIIIKVYPDIQSIKDFPCKTVNKILKKERKSREFCNYEWYYLNEL